MIKLLLASAFLSLLLTVHAKWPPQEWKEFNGYLYALVRIQSNQTVSEERCVDYGGHLVSIHSLEENNFVHDLRENNTIWIGRSKRNLPGVNGKYEWTDGTPDNFLIWDKRQPNEPWTDCMFMAWRPDAWGAWSDYACDGVLPIYYKPDPPYSVCKKPARVSNHKHWH